MNGFLNVQGCVRTAQVSAVNVILYNIRHFYIGDINFIIDRWRCISLSMQNYLVAKFNITLGL